MELSRRTFLKGTLAGGAGISLLGFDLTPVYAQTQSLKISRATRDAQHLSLLFGELRRDYLYAGRQGEECDPAGGARRGRSRPSHQSRNALSEGLVARAGHS